MFLFFTVIQAIVAAMLVGVILMQKSEGGGLGIGGSPTGMLSARGAADFLTRATRWLAIVFVALSILLAALAVRESTAGSLDTTLDRNVQPAAPVDPLGGPAPATAPTAPPPSVGQPAPQVPAAAPAGQATTTPPAAGSTSAADPLAVPAG